MSGDKTARKILVVDDEQGIVKAVERELRTAVSRYRYEVEGFTDPLEALERSRQQRFDAVISDYRMPGMNGLEFLKAFAEFQPDCARIVLSGETDMAALVRMVNETHIYRFIAKPWNGSLLINTLQQALDYSAALFENKRLANLIRTNSLLAMPVSEPGIEHLLIVDDDFGVLNGLSRILTRRSRVDDLYSAIRAELDQEQRPTLREGNLSVQISPSPLHALKMAESIQFSCLIADFKMPEMNGIELLQRFREIQPDCARILISGEVTKEELVQALETAQIDSYIPKPWNDFDLKTNIAVALSRRRLLLENRQLAELIKNT